MEDGKKLPICFQLKSMNNMIRRKLDVMFASTGLEELSGMQGPMIGYIYEQSRKQDIFQKDIEKAFNVRRSTATVMLQNLEQKGYIIREAVDYDARLKKILVTQKAEQYHFHIRKKIDEFNECLEAGITEADRKELDRILEKLQGNLANM